MGMDSSSSGLSRRGLLLGAVAGGGVLIAAALITPTEASAKVAQRSVAYRGAPNGTARCSNCALWQPPAACKVVEGVISPNGWCSIYAPKKA
jgi:hypothetical protein